MNNHLYTLWQTNIAMEYTIFNRTYIFQGSIFHCYVSLPECNGNLRRISWVNLPAPLCNQMEKHPVASWLANQPQPQHIPP